MKKEAYLYQKLPGGKVRCQTCAHQCLILPDRRGICGVRENIEGRLFVLTYGRAATEHLDPIEKKPLFHFLPGSQSYSVAAVGCNLACANCQNWDISQA
ncbi:MAG: radical SAM domain-containing protein, partial [Parcubacteria group bacterium LiPW_39]